MLSEALYTGAQDDEEEVVNQVLRTAKLVGLFVEPVVYCKMILPHIESSTSPRKLSSVLSVLAAYINGSNFELLEGQIEVICLTLESPDVCRYCVLVTSQRAVLS